MLLQCCKHFLFLNTDPVVGKIQMSKRCTLPKHCRKPPHPFISDLVPAKIQMSK
jgi:hypothetical protein